MNSINTIEKISKRFLIASFICGVGALISLVGLGLGFYLMWMIPHFMITFLITFMVSMLGVFTFGILEWKKKENRNNRVHQKEMILIEKGILKE